MTYTILATEEVVSKTIAALQENGITAMVADSKEDARAKVLSLIPEGSEVMTMTSVTLDELGLAEELNESGKYISVKKKLAAMGPDQAKEKRQLGAAPDFAVGSVQAITEAGHVLSASNTGSQLPAYAYGAGKVIWVVGLQKIVKDDDERKKRLYDYVLPLESERARKAYGVPGSNVSKVLVIRKEIVPHRTTIIFVPEVVGY
jgi:hypothetical protein